MGEHGWPWPSMGCCTRDDDDDDDNNNNNNNNNNYYYYYLFVSVHVIYNLRTALKKVGYFRSLRSLESSGRLGISVDM